MSKLLGRSVFLAVLALGLLSSVHADEMNTLEVVELISEQQTLAQQIAKTYFYIKQDIFTVAAKNEQSEALKFYAANRAKLKNLKVEDEYRKSFVLIDFMADDLLDSVSQRNQSKSTAAQIIELSEALTEAYEDLELKVSKDHKVKNLDYSITLDRQPIQVERLAKYYAAYSAGFNDYSTFEALKKSIDEFDKDLKYLLNNPSKVKAVDDEVKKVSGWWNTMKPYYESVEKEQLPVIVLVTTNKIMRAMHEAALIYSKEK